MINFDFSEKGLRIVLHHIFCVSFFKKMFLLLYSTIWINSLPNCLYFLRYWVICVLQLFVSLVVTSIKKSRQKHKYLGNKKRFWDEITNIYYFFKGLSVAKKCLRPESARLNPFYRYYFGRYSSELAQLVSLSHSRGRSTSYFNTLHDFSVSIPKC